jgi:hypothetical protein
MRDGSKKIAERLIKRALRKKARLIDIRTKHKRAVAMKAYTATETAVPITAPNRRKCYFVKVEQRESL